MSPAASTTETGGATGTTGTTAGSTAGTTGTTPSPATTTEAGAAGSSAQTYRLIANPSALTPHVGKKLELTGTIEDQNASPRGQATTAAAADALMSAPSLRVTAGKIVANSCE
jgi:hypothetical protein